eukprot:TRINITY_DN868_c0_g2_i1.p1 TRINITY_DN868_c0_g2~~TRINITY_DN868_c0_g2_i1.p1  ORF type:complete len:419 (+),score=70.56 TRINITY_DN868_c0_g2_i1:162-1259(+)
MSFNYLDYVFQNTENQRLVKKPGQINGIDFSCDNLQSCEVIVADFTAQFTIDDSNNCQFFIGPVEGSFMMRNCQNCVVTVACQQFRLRDCHNCTFYLYCGTQPVIESSDNLQFSPYNGSYPLADVHFDKASLNPDVNLWNQIYDFTPGNDGLHYTLSETVPHMIEMPFTDDEGNSLGPCVCPVSAPSLAPQPIPPPVDSDFQSFDFSVSQDQAQQLFASSSSSSYDAFDLSPAAPSQAPSMAMVEPELTPLDRWTIERREYLLRQRENALQSKRDARITAENELKAFYEQRQSRLSAVAQENRKTNDALLRDLNEPREAKAVEHAQDVAWDRVVSYIDQNGARDNQRVERMRSVLINLKHARNRK